ncbi:hypothetical protein MSAN_00579800 [Mycena sanguinolenta]|uniref:Uncharacterized protein n=1 Tax=Mycena sanguinolenta TaxID=230812 RepID=A0A8H6Z7E5_9AGAR|nr:hypothetical protein MSAN_00579800 [Mycena sanguinolenta]
MDLLNRLLNAKYFILRQVLHVEQVDGDDCYIIIARWISHTCAVLIDWLKDILWAVVKWIYNTFLVFLAWPGNALYGAAQHILRQVLHVEQVDDDDCYTTVARWISCIWAVFIAWLKAIFSAVVKWIYEAATQPILHQDGDDWYTTFARWISRIWAVLVAWLKAIFSPIVKWVYDIFPVFLTWLGNALFSAAQPIKDRPLIFAIVSGVIFLGPQILLLPLIIIWAVFLLLLGIIGFGRRGPVRGSFAAKFQSFFYGGNTPACSLFAMLQSIGMKYHAVTLSNRFLAIIRLIAGLIFVYAAHIRARRIVELNSDYRSQATAPGLKHAFLSNRCSFRSYWASRFGRKRSTLAGWNVHPISPNPGSEASMRLNERDVEVVKTNSSNGSDILTILTRSGPERDNARQKHDRCGERSQRQVLYIQVLNKLSGKKYEGQHYNDKEVIEEYLRSSGLAHAFLHLGAFTESLWIRRETPTGFDISIPKYSPTALQTFTWPFTAVCINHFRPSSRFRLPCRCRQDVVEFPAACNGCAERLGISSPVGSIESVF